MFEILNKYIVKREIINDEHIYCTSKMWGFVWNVGEFNNAVCPVCGYDSKIRIDLLDWNYCPKCGARMENVIS